MADETTSIAGDPLAGNMGATGSEAGGTEDTGAKRTASDTIREEASKYADQAKERMRGFAGEGKERATTALDEVASMMRTAAGDVDAKLGEQYGQYARTAADGIAGFADSIRGKEVDELLTEATEFVKKSPAIAVGTAAALGFVLARVIKSSMDAAGGASAPSAEDDKPTPAGGPAASPGTSQS